jgi:hypothetical protein
MADTSLRDALSGLNVPAAENYWGIGATTLGEIAPKLINPYGKVGTNLGIGLGSVLLTALLGYQARQTAAEESITTNKLANELMSLNTPEQRLARIEQAKGEMPARLTSRVLEFNTALQGQEKLNALEVARQKALEEAKLEVEMSPLGEKLFNRQLEKLREQQSLIGGRQRDVEQLKLQGKMNLAERQSQLRQEENKAKAYLDNLVKSQKLPNTASSLVGTTIRFGNDVQSLLNEIEGLSYAEYQYALKNPNYKDNLLAKVQSLKNTYINDITGKGITDKDREMTDIATGSSSIAGMDAVRSAWQNLKESAANKGKSTIAAYTQDPKELFAGLDQMSVPGGSFEFESTIQGFEESNRDLEQAIAPLSTQPGRNTIDPLEGVSAGAKEAIADIDKRNIPEAEKKKFRQRIIDRDRGQ